MHHSAMWACSAVSVAGRKTRAETHGHGTRSNIHVGERVGDTFICARTEATYWMRTEQGDGFKEEGGGEALGI